MASRDNQTMQIFLIVLALTSLLLVVGLVMVNSARTKAVAAAKGAKDETTEARNVQREVQAEAANYKLWMGYSEADTLQTLQQNFKEDMKKWGPTFEESQRSFRVLLENVFDENRKLAQSEADAKAQVKSMNQQLLATQAQTDDQIAKFKTESQKAQQDKETLRNEYAAGREKSEAEKKKTADLVASQNERIDTLNAEHGAAQQTLETKISKLERVIAIYKSNALPTDPYAQPADGRIAWVNQREGKVWINIGEADHLRPQVTFSVYSGDVNDVNAAESKGSIEIVRLLSGHMAEARITDDKAIRPLMEGDKVYSQVWSRGRQIGFAITGIVDLNNNGSSDLQQLERIIQLNNGKIDAVPDGKGGIQGEMTVDTRYLILGKHPEDGRESSNNARLAYQNMSAEAETLNIEVITLDDFLSLMGWASEHRAIKIGKGARSEDFPPRKIKDYKPRKLNSSKSLFRNRKPQLSY